MKVIIIDDESAMHLIMTRMLGKLPDLEVAGCFSDTASASRFIAQHEVHIAFVDISMPQESGMQFAERMAMNHPDLYIIFVTSHKDYALDAFELSALDYIVKPVSLERIEKAVTRAKAVHQFNRTSVVEPAANSVQIYTLGGLEVRTSAGSVRWISRKSSELFGFLLLHRRRIVTRARIIHEVFADTSTKNAETYLNTSIYQLRKALDPHGLKSIIQSDADGYGMNLDKATIDHLEFEDRLKKLEVIEAANLPFALDTEKMYVGDLFGEKGFGWALHEVERLSVLYNAFVKKVGNALLEQTKVEKAILLLNKLFHRNELDEETVMLLLRAYAAKKDRISFTKLYRGYTKALRLDLGIAPSKELEELYERLRSSFRIG
ncbi:response regulator [Halalkalibacter oceani]|uniref:response regulator n=1 Tax=Halalkalibacter oceani TaxID=1653776 RepID=UPI00339AEB74